MIVNKSIVSVVGLMSVTIIGASSLTNTAYAASYSTSISTSGSVSLNVGMNGNGANIATDNVKVVSTCPAGYTVGIAATSATNASFNDTTLYKDGNSANNTSSQKILTSTGTKDTPVSILDSNKKTWGYSIANDTTIHSNFIGLTATQAVPTASATGTTATGIDLPVYYGASVDDAIEPGEYKMSDNAVITYYLTANLDCTSYQVAFNPTSIFEGNTITGTGTMNNQRINEGVATPLDANGFTAPSGYYFVGWNTAQDGTGTSYAPGASVTDLTTAGNTITLYAQWTDCPGGNICYKENGTNVEGTMGQTTVSNTATSATLLASNFSRTGYGFAGWNTKADYTGTFYGPMETISFTAGQYSTKGLKLYAIWVASAGSMQNATTRDSVCNSLTKAPIDGTANLSSVSALTDQRDNNTYAIAKLADGKCWMIENLRLADKDSSNNDIELSATNTNSPSLPLTNIYDATNPTTSNHLSASITPSSSTPWCTTSSAACFDQSMLYTGNTTERGANPATGANTYSYGNYYNWYSATAGNGKYSTSTNNSVTAGDICPTGWALPESGDKTNMAAEKNNFYKLGLSLGLSAPANYDSQTRPYWTGSPEGSNASTVFRTYPNNFLYSGYVYGSSVTNRGSNGDYWSKSASNSNGAYYLDFYSSSVGPSYVSNKRYGFSVRCLAQ